MPELPEVENVRKKLEELVLDKEIIGVDVLVDRIIRTPDVSTFKEKVKGQVFKNVERLGKHLIFVLDDFFIVSHLRMEGKYTYTKTDTPLNKHDHVIFHFSNGFDLRYNDVRKFGTMDLVMEPNEVKSVAELGFEPMDSNLDEKYLKKQLSSKKTTIKNALLDQSIVSGLGNIYVDEVLFYSGIHPEKDANSLNQKQLKKLVEGIKSIIKTAIEKGGSSIRTYNSLGEKGSMQNLHHVYGKNGEPCINCLSPIEKIRVAGRGTHFCPKCQKK